MHNTTEHPAPVRVFRVFFRYTDHPLLQDIAADQVGKWLVSIPDSLIGFFGIRYCTALCVVDDFGDLVPLR